jgi:hypothetical protein
MWEVIELTGSWLVDAEGRRVAPERGGRVYSRHRTEEAADAARTRLLRISPSNIGVVEVLAAGKRAR